LPSQQQVRWSQLRVGIIVIIASITLGVLIFLMSGTAGLFTKKITLRAYFDNAQGLRTGAPVRIEGVDIGNVTDISVETSHVDPKKGALPVRVTFKIATKYPGAVRKDSAITLSTAGVLGETFMDIDSRQAKDRPVENGDELPTTETPGFNDVIRASQGTLQNVDILVRRVDRIVGQIESGNGSIGKLLYSEELYNRLNRSLSAVQTMISDIQSGKGSIGKLLNSDDLYNRLNGSIDNVNKIIDEVNAGNGTIGKLLKDPQLYDNANQTIAKANQLMADINAGKGALGKFAADPEFARKLDNTMTKLSSIADKMDSPDGTVGKLLTDGSVYNNTDQAIVEMRNLLKAVRENPKKYLTIHFKVF
jgi:phospholipid/cholesterol/gamma-HCH transport system substrate-binding protein